MIVDAREPAEPSIKADVCIIGGGAAGITIARELIGKRIDVCLLESGGLDPDDATQALYEGPCDSALIRAPRADYLSGSRLRYFGGSTNHWYGQCLPFDEIDFEQRPWVPHSGWPFRRAVLDPYYQRAMAVCQIDAAASDAPTATLPPDPLLGVDDAHGFASKRFLYSPPTRFGQVYRKEIADAPNISLHLHANVVEIESHRDGRQIQCVHVATLSGARFQVRARAYVLATGGVENARLLLNSDRVHSAGLGNDNDLVGRFFMEHPWTLYARARYWGANLGPLVTRNLQYGRATFWPTEATQRQLKLLNGVVQVHPVSTQKQTAPEGEAIVAHEIDRLLRAAADGEGEPDLAALFIQVEQSPNPDSRVSTTNERDALGQRKVRLAWRLNRLDQENSERLVDLFARVLGRQRLGRAQFVASDADPWAKGNVAWHHVGTTRMSQDPRQGVVDEHCRVHGIDNLFIAGSSVFPTGSFINPTLTLTALALRLADHLGGLLTARAGA